MSLKDIKFTAVVSGNIKGVFYDETEQKLYVKFMRNNSVYSYRKVAKKVFDELMKSPSIGSYFAQKIKSNNKYIAKNETI